MNIRTCFLYSIAVCVLLCSQIGYAKNELYNVSICILKERSSEIITSKILDMTKITALDVEEAISSMTNVFRYEFNAVLEHPYNSQFQIGRKKYEFNVELSSVQSNIVSVLYNIKTNDKRFFPEISTSGFGYAVQDNGQIAIYPIVSAIEGRRCYMILSVKKMGQAMNHESSK